MLNEFMEIWVLVAPWVFAGVGVVLTPFLLIQLRLLWRELKER